MWSEACDQGYVPHFKCQSSGPSTNPSFIAIDFGYFNHWSPTCNGVTYKTFQI